MAYVGGFSSAVTRLLRSRCQSCKDLCLSINHMSTLARTNQYSKNLRYSMCRNRQNGYCFGHVAEFSSATTHHNSDFAVPDHADPKSFANLGQLLQTDMVVLEDFINEEEETQLLQEIEPYMARLRYEYSHWDDAIHGYRETERSNWNVENSAVIKRIKETAFLNDDNPPTDFVHVLDLEEDGVIKPHKDSVRFCGDTIAGISLLSACVMRLVSINDKDNLIDILLKPRSLYIMRKTARYDYTHEILHKDHSVFKGETIDKGRRISIICRNQPTKDEME